MEHFLMTLGAALGEHIEVEVFSPSAAFSACTQPLPYLPGNRPLSPGRLSVGIECGNGASRYLQAELRVIGDYLVAAETIPADSLIGAAMLEVREGDLGRLPSRTLHDPDTAVGKLATRTLRAGQPIQTHQLRELPLVERRQRVTIEAQGNGFRVSREGQALEDGSLGEEVRVRLASRQVLTAVVVARGRLAIDY
ncbi:flagellar basal body P-ring formation chaperone FlgA [Halomonas sp. YLGW01]|uniref:flagellar basal body P-ring formation chaperone FlgA n=1 Tax=Halomonas sp. YLGW01 TaxID=2773308 RepID=UPI0024133D8A|nr:flagellar basal body P-ring formation chaperone FlgA [Halomonas sp. YLGW01]